MVGEAGKVIAAGLQEGMLQKLAKKIKGMELEDWALKPPGSFFTAAEGFSWSRGFGHTAGICQAGCSSARVLHYILSAMGFAIRGDGTQIAREAAMNVRDIIG